FRATDTAARSTRRRVARSGGAAWASWSFAGWPTRCATATRSRRGSGARPPTTVGGAGAALPRPGGKGRARGGGAAGRGAGGRAVAGVAPEEVTYVEAHGTATALGDPVEVAALAEAFGPGPRPGRCGIGSVKTNVGHLDAAAGVAGLIKTVLMLKNRELVPS